MAEASITAWGSSGASSPDLATLDALLADLQNTITPSQPPPLSQSPTGYGSLNGAPARYSPAPQSPTYQNSSMVNEMATTKSYTSTTKTNALNNNLSELDTLLQDLSNARYSGGTTTTTMERVSDSLNGGSEPVVKTTRTVSHARPSVDSLLDELSTVVPNGDLPDGHKLLVKKVVYERETQKAQAVPSASTATRELDDLMASLSDFKWLNEYFALLVRTIETVTAMMRKIKANNLQHQQVSESPYAKPTKAKQTQSSPNKQNLDSMLGNLHADMSRQGVNTTQKGCCHACEKPIVGQVITALGKTWHPEHFTCNHCNQELGTRNFFERDGRPYCEPDYHNLFSPRCAYCNGPILDKCVTALEKTWHTEHFFCAQCGKQFGEEGFHERDGKPYCRDDYFDMFAPKCGGCNRPIMENYISALNSQWHADCFVCRDCRQPFHGGSFFDHEGLPYCETHYHAKRGSLCAGCHKPITGRCITAMFRKFHPEHFVCAFCLKQLNKGTFKEQNDKPYCHGCFEKLFG
ncbi:paxillin isoform X4 [Thrips palmi]|uniref:Paxillin isoform X4 n=1 Tax=Thrips palmi TaxID=161013 RepID=A0A6P9A159_THRPL|nr:paxillin isoform X4 [Thrips palmi]